MKKINIIILAIFIVNLFGCNETIQGLSLDIISPIVIDSNAYRSGNFSLYPEITVDFSESMKFSNEELLSSDYILIVPTESFSEKMIDDINSPPASRQTQELAQRAEVFFEKDHMRLHVRALFALKPNLAYTLLLSKQITDSAGNPLLNIVEQDYHVKYGMLIAFHTGSKIDDEIPNIQMIVPQPNYPVAINTKHFLFQCNKPLTEFAKDSLYFQSLENEKDIVALESKLIDSEHIHAVVLETDNVFLKDKLYELRFKNAIALQNGKVIKEKTDPSIEFIISHNEQEFDASMVHEVSYFIKDTVLYVGVKTLVATYIEVFFHGQSAKNSFSQASFFSQKHEFQIGPIMTEEEYHLIVNAKDVSNAEIRIIDKSLPVQPSKEIYLSEVITDPQSDWITDTATETLQIYPGFQKPSYRDEWIELVHEEKEPINLSETTLIIQTIDSSPEQTMIDSDTVLFISDNGTLSEWKRGQYLVVNTNGNMNNNDLIIRIFYGDNIVADELILDKKTLSGNASSVQDESLCKIQKHWQKCLATPGSKNISTQVGEMK